MLDKLNNSGWMPSKQTAAIGAGSLAALIAAVVLIVMAAQQVHFSPVSPPYHTPTDIFMGSTGDLTRIISLITTGGVLAGAGLFGVKHLINKKIEEKSADSIEAHAESKFTLSESTKAKLRMAKMVFMIAALVAGIITAFVGINFLAHLAEGPVKDMLGPSVDPTTIITRCFTPSVMNALRAAGIGGALVGFALPQSIQEVLSRRKVQITQLRNQDL